MTRGLFGATVAVTAALSMGPASSGLLKSRVPQSKAAPGVTLATADPAPAEASAPANEPLDRPQLTLVPRNPKLASRLSDLLPPGMSVREAASGFGDQSQFVSAVHVSRNLGIPFTQLKAKIVDERMSLGQAIQALRPDADVWRELVRVRDVTSRDLY